MERGLTMYGRKFLFGAFGVETDIPKYLWWACDKTEATAFLGCLKGDLRISLVTYRNLSDWGFSQVYVTPNMETAVSDCFILSCQNRVIRFLA